MLKTGLVRAAAFANNDMLRTLLKYCKEPSNDVVDEMMKQAIESDNNETVKIVKNLFNDDRNVPENILDDARKRGIFSVLLTLEISTLTDEEIEMRKKEIIENIKNATAPATTIVPKSKDFGYNDQKIEKNLGDLLSKTGETIIVSFEDLLQFHLPELHYQLARDRDDDLGSLVPCHHFCPTREMCGVMQRASLISDYIRIQLGKKIQLFKLIKPPIVCGSLKEATRLFVFGRFTFFKLYF